MCFVQKAGRMREGVILSLRKPKFEMWLEVEELSLAKP